MKPPIRQLKKWIAALDSGEFKQGRNWLQVNDTYCCFGVGCKILIPDDKIVKWDGRIKGQRPTNQPASPEWFKQLDDDFLAKTGHQLTELNDYGIVHVFEENIPPFTFSEIATLMELVYIHKILD